MKNKNEIGNVDDFECKQNIVRRITRKVCRNNCKWWDHKNRKCLRGY